MLQAAVPTRKVYTLPLTSSNVMLVMPPAHINQWAHVNSTNWVKGETNVMLMLSPASSKQGQT